MNYLIKGLIFVMLLFGGFAATLFGTTTYEIWMYNYTNYDLTVSDTTFDTVWDEDYYIESSAWQGGSFEIDANYHLSDGTHYGYSYNYNFTGGGVVEGKYDTLAYGLYKLSTEFAAAPWVFFLDLRDSLSAPIDLNVKFSFPYDAGIWSWQYAAGTCDTGWFDIPNGDTLRIWEIWNDCDAAWASEDPNRSNFQPADPHSLSVTKTGGHPNLSWSGTPELDGVEKYEVWRKYGAYYTRIANNLTTKQYTDTDVDAFPKSSLYYYKILSVSGDGNIESEGYSNVVSFLGDGPVGKNIARPSEQILPTDFDIWSYPNPFNPTSTIVYELPKQSDVEILIYDISGQKVQNFMIDDKSAGVHELIWAGDNYLGNQVNSGTYFARVQAGTFSRVIRMIYLK